MDSHDRENLNFLLTSTPEEIRKWYDAVGEDDRNYASEIMTQYSEELALKQKFDDVESVNLDNLIPDAQMYLKRFRLKK